MRAARPRGVVDHRAQLPLVLDGAAEALGDLDGALQRHVGHVVDPEPDDRAVGQQGERPHPLRVSKGRPWR